MRKNRENIARLFFIIYIFSIIISSFFMVFHLDHVCIGEDCNVCYEINLLKSIFDNLLVLSLMYIFIKKLVSYIIKIKYIWQIDYCLSPVRLKVKMND